MVEDDELLATDAQLSSLLGAPAALELVLGARFEEPPATLLKPGERAGRNESLGTAAPADRRENPPAALFSKWLEERERGDPYTWV